MTAAETKDVELLREIAEEGVEVVVPPDFVNSGLPYGWGDAYYKRLTAAVDKLVYKAWETGAVLLIPTTTATKMNGHLSKWSFALKQGSPGGRACANASAKPRGGSALNSESSKAMAAARWGGHQEPYDRGDCSDAAEGCG